MSSQDTVKGQEAISVAPELPQDNCELSDYVLATGAKKKKKPKQVYKQNAALSSLSSCLPVETAEAGTSLMVQWLRLQAPNVGGQVLSLVRELDPTCCNQKGHMPGPSEGKYLKKKKKEQQKHQQASLF